MRSDSLPRVAPTPVAPPPVPVKPASLTPPPRSLSVGATAALKVGPKGGNGPGAVVGGSDSPAAEPSPPESESLYEPHGLFIANLPQGSTDAVLRQALSYHFSRFGTVASVKIKREKDVRPVAARKKEGDVWAWLSLATPDQATTALRGAQGIRVLGRTLRVERAKAHRILLLEPRGGAAFVQSAADSWLLRTSTGDFDLAESLGIECGTRSIEARRNGGGLLVKFGRVDGPALLERLKSNVHLSASMYVEDHTVTANGSRRSLPVLSPSLMLQRPPHVPGFAFAERGRTRHRQSAPAMRNGLDERAHAQPDDRLASSPKQTPQPWPGLRIAIPTPPRFQQASLVRQSTFRQPAESLAAGPVRSHPTRNDAEALAGTPGPYESHSAPPPFDLGRPFARPGFGPVIHATPLTGPFDTSHGTFDTNLYPYPPTPFTAPPPSPFNAFRPGHWSAYSSLPASPGQLPWPYPAPRLSSGVLSREDSPGWIQEPPINGPIAGRAPDLNATFEHPLSWPAPPYLGQTLLPSVPGAFFLPFRPPLAYIGQESFAAPPMAGPVSHSGFAPMQPSPPAPPVWVDGGFVPGWLDGRSGFADSTPPPPPPPFFLSRGLVPAAPRHDWRTDAYRPLTTESTPSSVPQPLDASDRDFLH